MIPKALIVHYPTTPTSEEALAQRVAQIHAQAVIELLKNLPCSAEQKRLLADSLKVKTRR